VGCFVLCYDGIDAHKGMSMNLNEYIIRVNERLASTPHLRLGQVYFDVLYEMNPWLANDVIGTEYDPYETNDMDTFLTWLGEHCE
jgi:hypothetical protein